MPEPSETTPTPSTDKLTSIFTQVLSAENGAEIVAEYAARNRLQAATWIVTTTTAQDSPEVWRVQVTKAVTP